MASVLSTDPASCNRVQLVSSTIALAVIRLEMPSIQPVQLMWKPWRLPLAVVRIV